MLKDISLHKPIWMGFDDLKHIRQLSLCREGGATLLSTGSHESCVGCRQPEIRRIALWSWVSMRIVQLDLAHTGQQYSATE